MEKVDVSHREKLQECANVIKDMVVFTVKLNNYKIKFIGFTHFTTNIYFI